MRIIQQLYLHDKSKNLDKSAENAASITQLNRRTAMLRGGRAASSDPRPHPAAPSATRCNQLGTQAVIEVWISWRRHVLQVLSPSELRRDVTLHRRGAADEHTLNTEQVPAAQEAAVQLIGWLIRRMVGCCKKGQLAHRPPRVPCLLGMQLQAAACPTPPPAEAAGPGSTPRPVAFSGLRPEAVLEAEAHPPVVVPVLVDTVMRQSGERVTIMRWRWSCMVVGGEQAVGRWARRRESE